MKWKLVKATNKTTNEPTQEKYIGTIGAIIKMQPLVFMVTEETENPLGLGFVTSEVASQIIDEDSLTFYTQNSMYYFEKYRKEA
jgi:hypothetical protein